MSARVAVVTGAASGIGLGVAHRLAEAGHAVALLDRDGAGAEAAAADLSGEAPGPPPTRPTSPTGRRSSGCSPRCGSSSARSPSW